MLRTWGRWSFPRRSGGGGGNCRRSALQAAAKSGVRSAVQSERPADRVGRFKNLVHRRQGPGHAEARDARRTAPSIDHRPADWHALWQILDQDSAALLGDLPAPRRLSRRSAPLAADGDDLDGLLPHLSAGMEAAGVRLLAIHSRAVFSGAVQRLMRSSRQQGGNALVRHARVDRTIDGPSRRPAGPRCSCCDKHGGRNFYGPLLQRRFPDGWSKCMTKG